MKKRFYLLTALVMLLLLLCACGRETATSETAAESSPAQAAASEGEPVTLAAESSRETLVEAMGELEDGSIRLFEVTAQLPLASPVRQWCAVGETLYAITTEDEGQRLCTVSVENGTMTALDAPTAASNFLSERDRQLWLLAAEDETWTVSVLDENGQWTQQLTVQCSSDDATAFEAGRDGVFYVTTKTTCYVLDAEAGLLGELTYGKANLNGLLRTADGQILTETASGDKTVDWETFLVLEIDLDKMELTPLEALSDDGKALNSSAILSGNGVADLCMDDFEDIGRLDSYLYFQGEFLVVLSDRETGELFLCALTPGSKEIQIVTLGSTRSATVYLNDAILAFNAASDTYRIRIEYFEDSGSTYNSLNLQMLTGNSPDLLFTSADMYSVYYQRGYLVDLYTMLAQETVDALDAGLLDAMSISDALYVVYPQFTIQTMLGRTETFGEETSWTIQEALALKESSYRNGVLFNGMEAYQPLETLLQLNLQYFVDYEAGTCEMDSDGFRDLLQLAMTQGLIEDEAQWVPPAALYTSITGLDQYEQTLLEYGEEFHYVGIPTVEGSGHYMVGTFPIGVCAFGENQAGAIAFVEYLLSEEYQSQCDFLPIRTDVLEQRIAKAMTERELTTVSNGSGESDALGIASGTVGAETSSVTLRALTEEEVAQFRDILSSLTCTVSPMMTELIGIIEEEYEPYFSGEKTLDDIIPIIQSRAEIFVAERQ